MGGATASLLMVLLESCSFAIQARVEGQGISMYVADVRHLVVVFGPLDS